MELPELGRLVNWIWERRPDSRPVAGADMKSFNDILISILAYTPDPHHVNGEFGGRER